MNNVNEGLEYAQMLEIPVSTVSVLKKRSIFGKRAKPADDLKDKVVDSVNDKLVGEAVKAPNEAFVQAEDLTAPAKKERRRTKKINASSAVLIGETVAACLLAGGIFLTNMLVPNTAINAFVGNLTAIKEKEASYREFVLTSPVSETSDAQVTVSGDGVIRFTEKTSVYPLCDGEVADVSQADGLYTVKIAHTSTFCSIVTGLDKVYAAVGEEVKGNLPFAYSEGKGEVRISMYDGETLLNCYTIAGAVPVWNS